MKKIKSLTKEQIDRFPEFVKRWTEIGLCTDPADRPRAEDAIRKCYEIAGLKHPEKIVWCESPLSAGLTRAIVMGLKVPEVQAGASVWASVGVSVRASVRASVWDSVEDSVWDSVWDSVRASVWDSVGASVRASVGASVRASVWDSVEDSVWASVGVSVRASVRASVWDSVGASVRASVGASVRASVGASVGASVRASVWDSVEDSVWASVWDSVEDSVRASVWDSVEDSVGASGYGQHDASWLSFYEYFRDACGLSEETQMLTGLWELAQSANWWLPHEKICWVSERHNVLNRDVGGRLHCETGPALSYPDGFSIWAWHGLRVDRRVIESPETITVAEIEKEENAEVRRVLIERYGQERYLMDSGAEEIHRDDFGILYCKEIPDDEPIVMVKVVNSTPEPDGSFKDYFLRVPPEFAGKHRLGSSVSDDEKRVYRCTAKDAVAWTCFQEESTYNPMVET